MKSLLVDWGLLLLVSSLTVKSMGVLAGLHPSMPVWVNKSKTCFCWETRYLSLIDLFTYQGKYLMFPKSLISNYFAKKTFICWISLWFLLSLMSSIHTNWWLLSFLRGNVPRVRCDPTNIESDHILLYPWWTIQIIHEEIVWVCMYIYVCI